MGSSGRPASAPRGTGAYGGRQVVVALIASYGLAAYMILGPLAYLRRISGGLLPFDLRPFGYTATEARALTSAPSCGAATMRTSLLMFARI